MALGWRQAKFVQEYIKSGNGKAAAIAAGYKESDARSWAAHLLKKPNIKERLKDERDAASVRAAISVARTLREISYVAHSDIADILDFSGENLRLKRAMDIPKRARGAIASIKVKRTLEGGGENVREVEFIEFKFWDKVAALEKLCKHLAIFVDQEELEKLKADIAELKARSGRGAKDE